MGIGNRVVGLRVKGPGGGTHMPIFLVTVFAKNEQDNLSKAEQAAAVQQSKILLDTYGDKQ